MSVGYEIILRICSCNMRVGGGSCHFVLVSISCIVVRCFGFRA